MYCTRARSHTYRQHGRKALTISRMGKRMPTPVTEVKKVGLQACMQSKLLARSMHTNADAGACGHIQPMGCDALTKMP